MGSQWLGRRGNFILWQGMPQSREGPSNKDFDEVYHAWVLVELFLQCQVLQWSQLFVPEQSEEGEGEGYPSSGSAPRGPPGPAPYRLSRCSKIRMRNMA